MDAISNVDLHGVATQLDSDILETECRLDELRAMRENIDPLIKYMAASGPHPLVTSTKASLTDHVVGVFLHHPTAVFEVDHVVDHLKHDGIEAERQSVRNAVYYGVNSGRLDKRGRGRFALRDTSAPEQLAD